MHGDRNEQSETWGSVLVGTRLSGGGGEVVELQQGFQQSLRGVLEQRALQGCLAVG